MNAFLQILLLSGTVLSAQVSVPALDPPGLAKMLKAGSWSVIEFGGPTCIPCKKMQPILAELQQQFGSRARFRNFYVTEFPKESREHKILLMPTQVIFDPRGKEVARHQGYWPKDEFLAALGAAGLK